MPLLTPPAIALPAPAPRAPDLVMVDAPGPVSAVVTFDGGEVECDGQAVARSGAVIPFATTITRYRAGPEAVADAFRFTFAIDATGRPHLIRRQETPRSVGYYVDSGDLAPALAASRFPPGAPRPRCSITYRTTTIPVASAPVAALYELASRPEPGVLPRELFERLTPLGSDCRRGPGPYRQLNQPAFETIAQAAGTWSWTFLAFDVSRTGRPTNVRLLGSAGNQPLDRAGVRALAANRYAPGPGYRGCTYHFFRVGSPDGYRPELPADTPADNGEVARCRIDPGTMRGLLDGTAYPTAFARRRIEGVAAVSFDTAPWGAIGNLKVLASEPDEAFGEAARDGFAGAKVAARDTGHRGCVRHVRFKLPSVAR